MNEFEQKLIEVLNIMRTQPKIKKVEIYYQVIGHGVYEVIKPHIEIEYYE